MARNFIDPQSPETRRILLVEDERVIRLSVEAALKKLGYEVVGHTGSGREAVQLAGDLRPDLVLMDVILDGSDPDAARPGPSDNPLDGIEAAAQIGAIYDIPVVFLTAHADQATLERAKLTGPFGYILKPPSPSDLHTAVELALYKHALEQSLKRAMHEAEEADRLKASFLATVSHEIRTPMNGILGMAELLLLADLGQEHKENVALLKSSAMSLMGVLNHILEYSKLDAQRYDPDRSDFSLHEALEALRLEYQFLAKEHGADIRLDLAPGLPDKVYGDLESLRRVLGQLVDNALRHGRTDLVAIRCEPCPAELLPRGMAATPHQAWVHLAVLDQGQGVPEDKLEHIFKTFVQMEGYMTRSQGGLGLGLAMCRKLIEAMGGRIWARRRSQGGMGLHLVLPLVVRAKARPAAGAPLPLDLESGPPPSGEARVLVVDDDLVSRLFVARVLEKNGYEVLEAGDGEQALEKLDKQAVDAVLMDVEMPGLNGIEATRKIRVGERGGDAGVPIIALTAHAMWGDEERCLDAGMNDYLPKPVERKALLGILAQVLNRPRSG